MSTQNLTIDVNNIPYVFVYGTLKRGGSNHGLLQGAEFISESVTLHEYVLRDNGGFPSMCHYAVDDDPAVYRVRGELFKITADHLQDLDWLEGHPSFYYRSPIDLVHGKAWAYFNHNQNPLCPVIDGAYEWN